PKNAPGLVRSTRIRITMARPPHLTQGSRPPASVTRAMPGPSGRTSAAACRTGGAPRSRWLLLRLPVLRGRTLHARGNADAHGRGARPRYVAQDRVRLR